MSVNTQLCPVCGSGNLNSFFKVTGVPVNIGILWPDREAAIQCLKGDIHLAFCIACGFITNLMFDPARVEYTQEYDNSLFFSPFYQNYSRSTAVRLIERYALRNKSVIEIGSGKGDFLVLLCELGMNRAVGFDPSFNPASSKVGNIGSVTIIQDYYSEKYSHYKADLVCCRYVFEHLPDPVSFLGMVRRAIGEKKDTVLYFEVPNALYIIRNLSVWDIIYEHCSYFCRNSLSYVFTHCGFSVRSLEELFDAEYLQIEATPGGKEGRAVCLGGEETEEIAEEVAKFKKGFAEKMAAWRKCLNDLKKTGRRTVLWGAGAKGVSFLNMLQVQDEVACVVDINPQKRSMYIPGTGHKILAPGDLRNDPPDVVLIMNHVYGEEIRSQIESLGFSTEILLVDKISDR